MAIQDHARTRSEDQFVPPATQEDAQRRRLEAAEKVARIQAALADKNRSGADGQRTDSVSYHEWRRRAVFALGATQGELRRLNAWIKENNKASAVARYRAFGLDAKDPESLLSAAYELLKRLAQDGVDLDPGEQAVVDALGDYVHSTGQR